MPSTVDFTVPAHAVGPAIEASRDALRGRGFTVEDGADGLILATRGSRVLTTVLGGLVPPRRQYFRLGIETLVEGRRSVLRLHAADHGAAIAGGAAGSRRLSAALAWAANGIEAAFVAAGVPSTRHDHS